MKTVIGLYDDFSTAQQVVQELVNSGFSRDEISLVANNQSGTTTTTTGGSTTTSEDVDAGEGATVGALEGGIIGLLAGLGAMAIPGIGPVLAAGPLIGALTGAAAGAVTGGLTAGLVDSGVSETDATYYEEGIRRGGTLVTVQTDDDAQVNRAVDILNRYGAIDIDERASQWSSGSTGSTGTTATTQSSYTDTSASTNLGSTTNVDTTRSEGDVVLPVVEEEVRVGKREVERGGVRVHTRVSERPVQEQVTLREETVTVERRPVDRAVSDADLSNLQEGTIELTERSEEAVVSKEARVVEEVVLNKDVDVRTETINATVRRTDVDVEEVAGTTRTTDYDTDFRSHWQSNYGSSGRNYDYYAPGYQYGSSLRSNSAYSGRQWNDIESDVRTDWESRGHGAWEDFKDSVRYGWERVKDAAR